MNAGLPSEDARMIAERAIAGRSSRAGSRTSTSARVVAKVPAEAASVAWLHDVLEWTELTEDDSALAGLAPRERMALRLLTRRGGTMTSDSSRTYGSSRPPPAAPAGSPGRRAPTWRTACARHAIRRRPGGPPTAAP